MSGGSYNYLCYKDPDSIMNEIGELEKMRDKLIELDYLDAAKETESIILVIKSFFVQMESRIERLSGVWKAVEWMDSGDWGVEEVLKEINDYRGL